MCIVALLYNLSNYNFIIEHKCSGPIVNLDYLTREGRSGAPTPEELDHTQYENTTNGNMKWMPIVWFALK